MCASSTTRNVSCTHRFCHERTTDSSKWCCLFRQQFGVAIWLWVIVLAAMSVRIWRKKTIGRIGPEMMKHCGATMYLAAYQMQLTERAIDSFKHPITWQLAYCIHGHAKNIPFVIGAWFSFFFFVLGISLQNVIPFRFAQFTLFVLHKQPLHANFILHAERRKWNLESYWRNAYIYYLVFCKRCSHRNTRFCCSAGTPIKKN